ncbi:Leucine-rich repeat domain superfamily [Sesbania bispinosa]|nr:Leucine-rich repeat domain superfamily [Sesbania bispinosa]
MSSIKPSSLSLLLNFSSSLVSLSLYNTGLQGKLADNNMLCLPNLQKLDLSWNRNLEGELPKFNWSTPLRHSNFEGPILLFLSNLTQLEYLDLGENKFSGTHSSMVGEHDAAKLFEPPIQQL